MNISSWGRLSADEHNIVPMTDRTRVAETLSGSAPGVCFGMGRSYGDACLNPGGTLWTASGLSRFISFDEQTGRLVCEAGVLLRDIQRMAVPRGWMLPVTPGTQLVTVGGAIANDVHGKNHHVFGSFGCHVTGLQLVRSNGEIIDCSPDQHAKWLCATIGGLGLTGVIATAELQLKRVQGPWLQAETIPFLGLDEFFHLADSSEADWEHTVSWIDCLAGAAGRGLFMRANHCDLSTSRPKPRHLAMPLTPPVSLVNAWTLKPFNWAYYTATKRKAGLADCDYESFFYPLDNVQNWNRMYGPRGFYQYQSVVPRSAGREAIQNMLSEIALSGQGSFLAVLKTFGDKPSLGMLSFPQPGVTLALDFPNKGRQTLALFDRLDAIVRQAGGRIYPAKDARMPRDLFESGYPRLNEFMPYRDPGISSAMSRRLMGN
ncbi:MAG TPA: FAD-binding oxidoreductase [Eoetvoesiella sp.]|uniref:FAD-binding oxidoreductase n=1 Tax=Eoetvoesiella sp. TaxID=1966355 RepID=UPI002C4D7833|nr:FAD-binding oxidoreductase [Eoetvoesiella sp.]HWK61400.1 FAD-binding oxidoreductase [Eoetvoesiella sp.]